MEAGTRRGLALGIVAVAGVLLLTVMTAPEEPLELPRAPTPGAVAAVAGDTVAVPGLPPSRSGQSSEEAAPPVQEPTQRDGPGSTPEPGPTAAPAQGNGARLTGQVVDENGVPVAGAEVVVDVRGRRVGRDRTDATGNFTVSDLPAGTLGVLARRQSWVDTGYQGLTLAEDEHVEGLRLVLKRGHAVSGRVFANDTGLPIQGGVSARLMTVPPHPMVDTHRVARCDGDGGFRLRGLVPGVWRVRVGGSDAYLPQEMEHTVTGGDDGLGEIGLDPGAVLIGTVSLPDGTPTDDFDLWVWRGGERVTSALGRIPYRTGAFAPSSEPVKVEVVSSGVGGCIATLKAVTTPGEHVRDFVLEPPASLQGRVVDSLGRPVPGVVVRAMSSETRAETDLRGSFELSPLFSGVKRIIASGEGYNAETLVVELSTGEQRQGAAIRLEPWAVLEVVASGCTPGRRVHARRVGSELYAFETPEGETAVLRTFGPYAASCSLWIYQEGSGAGLVETVPMVRGETTRIARRLEPGVHVDGQVIFSTRRPNKITIVEATSGFPTPRPRCEVAYDGSFAYRLPPGRYLLQAWQSGFREGGPVEELIVPAGVERVAFALRFP